MKKKTLMASSTHKIKHSVHFQKGNYLKTSKDISSTGSGEIFSECKNDHQYSKSSEYQEGDK